MTRAGQSPEEVYILHLINWGLLGVFTIEQLLKLCVLGPVYWNQKWNLFDAVVVLLALIGQVWMAWVMMTQTPSFLL